MAIRSKKWEFFEGYKLLVVSYFKSYKYTSLCVCVCVWKEVLKRHFDSCIYVVVGFLFVCFLLFSNVSFLSKESFSVFYCWMDQPFMTYSVVVCFFFISFQYDVNKLRFPTQNDIYTRFHFWQSEFIFSWYFSCCSPETYLPLAESSLIFQGPKLVKNLGKFQWKTAISSAEVSWIQVVLN